MLSSNVAPIINQMVDLMLRGGHTIDHKNKVLFITLKLEVAEDRQDDAKQCRYINLMYYAPNRYVTVGAQESSWAGVENHHEWQYRSNHDSCWRSDGTDRVLWEAYIAMCNSAFPDVAPAELHATAEICNIRFREVKNVDSRRRDGLIHLEF